MASGVNYSTQQYFGFDPRTIPQCSVWLDAADSSTITYSTAPTISQLRNKAVDGTAAFAAGTPSLSASAINGRPAFLLGSGNYLAGGIIPNINQSTLSCFAVAVTTATLPKSGPDQRLISLMSPTDLDYNTSLTAIGLFNQSGTSSIGTYRNNVFVSTSTISQNTPFLAGSVYNGSTGRLWKDGTAGSGPTATTGNFGITKYSIGIHVNNAGALEYWIGSVGEVLIYSTALSDVQRQQVEGYLAWKWGLQANLPTGHPFKPNPTAMRAFQPIDISNCILWLDGADSRTVGVSGSNVTAWNDKSGLGNNLTTISPTAPTYSSTTGAITFDGTNSTSIRGSLNASYSNPLSLFVVCSITSNVTGIYGPRLVEMGNSLTGGYNVMAGQLNIIINASTGSTPGFVVYANNGQDQTGTGINNQTYIPTTFNTIGIYENFSSYVGTTLTLNTYLTGNTSTFSSRTTTWTVSPPYYTSTSVIALGGYTIGGTHPGDSFSGNMYEVLLFSRALSTAERQQIEGYLASKWRLSTLLPNSQPFYLQRTLPSTPQFVPTTLSNCSLWLDAADSSVITLSGSNVTTWSDKSGSNYNFTNNSTVTPFSLNNFPVYTSNGLNGLPVVTFATSGQVLGSSDVFAGNQTQSFTIFSVGPLNSINRGRDGYGAGWSISILPSNTSDSYVLTTNGTAQYNIIRSTASIPIYATTVAQTTSTTATVRINGSQTGTSNFANYTLRSSTIGFYIGFGGYVGETIIYTRVLSLTELQRVEGYLAWKWGLQNNLPTTHPYYKFRP